MQFEISDEAALTFASEFYGALADGYPVDAALGQSRQAVYLQGRTLEWATPVLYLRTPDGRIFDIERTSSKPSEGVEQRPRPAAKTSKGVGALLGIVCIVALAILYGFPGRKTRSFPVVTLFEVKPASIHQGEKAELFWKASDAKTISISHIGRVDVPSGSTSVAFRSGRSGKCLRRPNPSRGDARSRSSLGIRTLRRVSSGTLSM